MEKVTREFSKEAMALNLNDTEARELLFYLLGAMEVNGVADEETFDMAVRYALKGRE